MLKCLDLILYSVDGSEENQTRELVLRSTIVVMWRIKIEVETKKKKKAREGDQVIKLHDFHSAFKMSSLLK